MKKDFAGFQGLTPTGTPAPGDVDGEKKDEKKGFGFAAAAAAAAAATKEGDTKTGFAFGGKKDDTAGLEKKEEEKPKGFAFGGETKVDVASTLQGMKNKTMEEIINKWTGELDRCGEQFKLQASDIRRWDSILVENGDKVPPHLQFTC